METARERYRPARSFTDNSTAVRFSLPD